MNLNHQEAFIAFFNRHPQFAIPDDINDDDVMALGYGDVMGYDGPGRLRRSFASADERIRLRIGGRLALAYKKGRTFGGDVWDAVLAGEQPLWEGYSERYAIYRLHDNQDNVLVPRYVAWDYTDPARARGDAMAAPFLTFHQALDYIEPFEQVALDELAESDPSLIKEDLRNGGLHDEDGDDRYFIVVCAGTETDPHGASEMWAASRRKSGDRGPFSGPWRLLTETEAHELADAINADPAPGTAYALPVYRYDKDPVWTEEHA